MRLFVAIKIPDNIRADVGSRTRNLELPGLRWTPPESLHITLKFLGEVAEERLAEIERCLSKTGQGHRPLSLSLANGGVFPDRSTPKIFWTALAGDVKGLSTLAEGLEEALAEIGFPKEERKFKPHLTLARCEPSKIAGEQFCTLFSTYQSPVFVANEIHLVRSHLGPQGPRYETLKTFPLGPR